MPERNMALLEKTMQHIEDHPETHDQHMFWCGTSGCFAGWACALSGYTNTELHNWTTRSGDSLYIPFVAQELLGLTLEERFLLFAPSNTRPMLRLMVKDLVNGEELRPSEEYREEVTSA